ncbi:uncharacterized protein C2845_PM08G06440 [Panicum miliaceum]|uniref:Uncharacterized protein n=1 Tax=Panicum miliaceum TaxID=4540 RepID=A0A3L6R073_PANMI|nr:uncharacterized protein C2845_PM08G06440 [Panicum miliaceum]
MEGVSSSAKNAVGFSSPVNAGDSSKQPLGSDLGEQEQGALSKEGSKDAGAGISNSGVAVASAAPPDPGAEGGNDEAPEKDDDPSAVAVLPPLSSDSADTTQESGVLEDQELQVQNAVAEAANPPENSDGASSSTNGSSSSVIPFPSDPAEIPAPAPAPAIEAPADQIPEIEALPPSTPEIEASPVQLIPPTPEVKQDWEAPAREWKPLCDVTSNHRIDWCELDGDVRVLGANASVTLVAPPGADGRTFREESWRVKPYPRKADPNAMRNVRVVTVRSVPAAGAPACTDRHDVPALVFSDRGYTGNYFHAYTDVVLPLFLTARQYGGEVLLLATDLQAWWVGKYAPVFRSLSNYEPVDLGRDPRVHCFRRVQVGLTSHDDFSIDPRRAPNGYSMLDFTAFLRDAVPVAPRPGQGQGRRPRLLVIARARNRRFLNVEEIARGARRVGFEVVVSEGGHEVLSKSKGCYGLPLTNPPSITSGQTMTATLPRKSTAE